MAQAQNNLKQVMISSSSYYKHKISPCMINIRAKIFSMANRGLYYYYLTLLLYMHSTGELPLLPDQILHICYNNIMV